MSFKFINASMLEYIRLKYVNNVDCIKIVTIDNKKKLTKFPISMTDSLIGMYFYFRKPIKTVVTASVCVLVNIKIIQNCLWFCKLKL